MEAAAAADTKEAEIEKAAAAEIAAEKDDGIKTLSSKFGWNLRYFRL